MESGQALTLGLHGSIDSLKSFALFIIISISLIRLFLWTSSTNHFQNDFVVYKVNSSTMSMSYFQQINSSDNHHDGVTLKVCIYLCNKSWAWVLCSLIMHSVDFLIMPAGRRPKGIIKSLQSALSRKQSTKAKDLVFVMHSWVCITQL